MQGRVGQELLLHKLRSFTPRLLAPRRLPVRITQALNSRPQTLNPKPYTVNSQPSTLNSQPATLYPLPPTLNPQPSTLDLHLLALRSEAVKVSVFEFIMRGAGQIHRS